MFTSGVYTITKVVGGSPENGEIDVYVLYEDNIRRPASDLEAMMIAGQQPGKLIVQFREGRGMTVLDQKIYGDWFEHIRAELERQRDSKRGPERILAMYFLDELLNPTSAESHSPQPQPASHRE